MEYDTTAMPKLCESCGKNVGNQSWTIHGKLLCGTCLEKIYGLNGSNK